MARLTISTNGMGRRPMGADETSTPECHDVQGIEHIRYVAGEFDRSLAVVTLDIDQALAIAYDLLYQAVDAGKIAGWNVSFPESEKTVAVQHACP